MDAFVWSDRFATGIESIDTQHQQLFRIINEVGDMLARGDEATDAEAEAMIHRLADYARFHFADEERVWTEGGLAPDAIAAHKQLHLGFSAQVVAMWQGRASMADPAQTLYGFLSSWLVYHILGDDQKMARQIGRVGDGTTPAEAPLAEADAVELSNSALLQAMQNLYGVVSEQNRELARANVELEARVAERTRELLQAEKMASIGQLAAGVAHEINNPIGFVNSNLGTLNHYVEQLLRLAELGVSVPAGQALAAEIDFDFMRSDLPGLLKDSREGLERVRKIVADLKDFSHVDEAEWQEADLLAGLESTLNVVAHELKYKAEIVRLLAPLPPVRCIPAQINQVFMNLLVNAAQAIAEHGVITLRSGQAGERVWVEIADTGSGMDETTRRRLFEPFYTTKPVGTGTGLGLSVTWEIMQQHGGTLDVTSAPGQGSSFRVWLPIAGPALRQGATP
jgi:hemerythrin-like metal-binding protein